MSEGGRSGVTVLPLESPLAAVGRSPLISALFAPELAAGVTVFELARIMGTSVRQLEDTYFRWLSRTDDQVRVFLDEYDAKRAVV